MGGSASPLAAHQSVSACFPAVVVVVGVVVRVVPARSPDVRACLGCRREDPGAFLRPAEEGEAGTTGGSIVAAIGLPCLTVAYRLLRMCVRSLIDCGPKCEGQDEENWFACRDLASLVFG